MLKTQKRISLLIACKDAKDCVVTTSDKIQGLVKFSYFVSRQTTITIVFYCSNSSQWMSRLW
jgi:hypothetical protein